MFESEERTTNQWLAKLVAEIAGAIGCLDQDLLWGLVEPLAYRQHLLPSTVFIGARVRGDINSCTCDRPRALATTHTVANLTTSTCRSTIEWLDCSWEVVGFCLERDHTLNIFYLEIVGFRMVSWSELLNHWSFSKGHIVFVSRNNLTSVGFGGVLDQLEQA